MNYCVYHFINKYIKLRFKREIINNYKMRIEINPRSLLNLENICEVLYKLHPSVLNDLIEMERSLGKILGEIDLNNISLEEREFLSKYFKEKDLSNEEEKDLSNEEEEYKNKQSKSIQEMKEDKNSHRFHKLRRYIQLDTHEFIPMKISVEVEDPDIGKKVKELVEALEKTRAPEQFYFHKREVDEDAYFAEGYGLTMNEEQLKSRDDFFDEEDVKGL